MFYHSGIILIIESMRKKSFFGNFPFVTPSPTLYPTGSPSQSRCISGSACSGSCVWRWAPTRHTAQRASSTWSPPRPSQRSETWSSPTPSCSARAERGCEPAACRTGRSGSLCSRVLASCRGSWWLSQWNVDGRVTTNSKMEFCYKLKNGVGPVQLFTDTGLKCVDTTQRDVSQENFCGRDVTQNTSSSETVKKSSRLFYSSRFRFWKEKWLLRKISCLSMSTRFLSLSFPFAVLLCRYSLAVSFQCVDVLVVMNSFSLEMPAVSGAAGAYTVHWMLLHSDLHLRFVHSFTTSFQFS